MGDMKQIKYTTFALSLIKYNKMALLKLDKLRTFQLQKIRNFLYPHSFLLVGKKTLLKKLLRLSLLDNENSFKKWYKLIVEIHSNIGIIFYEGAIFDLCSALAKFG